MHADALEGGLLVAAVREYSLPGSGRVGSVPLQDEQEEMDIYT